MAFVPFDVADDEEIEQPIVVVVEPGRGYRPLTILRKRQFLERAVAAIPEQMIRADAGDKEIRPAVVVEIGGGDAHRVAPRFDAGLRGDIGKRAVPVVA